MSPDTSLHHSSRTSFGSLDRVRNRRHEGERAGFDPGAKNMYRLELDLDVYFVPPMDANGAGISLTRSLTVPFPPWTGLNVCSRRIDEPADPAGFSLRDVVWDMDRQVFLASTTLEIQALPIAWIPEWIRGWLDLGWRVGSYADGYAESDEDTVSSEAAVEPAKASAADEELHEKMHQLAQNRRPRWFNQLFRALVRQMAETFNNSEVAYAMDSTARYFSEEDLKAAPTPAMKKWSAARDEFRRMDVDQQLSWRDKAAKYPSLEAVVAERRRADKPKPT